MEKNGECVFGLRGFFPLAFFAPSLSPCESSASEAECSASDDDDCLSLSLSTASSARRTAASSSPSPSRFPEALANCS